MRLGLPVLLALAASVRANAAADPARYLKAELVSETMHPKPGSTILIGIRMTPKPGWHGYWSNPGDSGIAPSGRWSAPRSVRIGPLLHPAPSLMVADGVTSFVHNGPHMLLARMHLSPNIKAGSRLPLIADLRWAACTATQCVPLKAKLRIDLTAGNGRAGPDVRAIRAAASKLPRDAPDGTYVRDGRLLRLTLPAAARLNPSKSTYFPDGSAAFDVAHEMRSRRGGRTVIAVPLRSAPPSRFGGVISDGAHAYRIRFHPAGH
jgi:DsbC/DsbD-like thiol-disulfide interchange protein